MSQSTRAEDDITQSSPNIENEQGNERHNTGKFALQWKDINFRVLAQKNSRIIPESLTRWFYDEEPIKEDQQILKNSCGYVK